MPVIHVGLSPFLGPSSPHSTLPPHGCPSLIPGLGSICAQGPPSTCWGWWELSREPLCLRTAGPRFMITPRRDFSLQAPDTA